MRFRLWFILLLLFLGATSGGAFAPEAKPVTDPELVSAHYRQVAARPEFRDDSQPDVNDTFKKWLAQYFTRLGAKFEEFTYTGQMPRLASFLMTLLVVVALGGLLYTALRLTRGQVQWNQVPSPPGPEEKKLLPPEFYEEELHQAVAARDWHGAWLATWRQLLSRMEKGHLVEPDRTRTNREYLSQLRAHALPHSALALLSETVDTYDRFIYGRQSIAERDWKLFHEQVSEATLLLHLQERNPATMSRTGGS